MSDDHPVDSEGPSEDVGHAASSTGAAGISWQMSRVRRYVDYCEFYHVPVHPLVMVAFRYPRVQHLVVDADFTTRDVLPLADMLAGDNVITHLDLHKARSLGNAVAYALANVLTHARTLTHVNLSSQDIGEHGAVALAKACALNPVLTHLILRGNRVGPAGAAAFARALSSPVTHKVRKGAAATDARLPPARSDATCGLTYLDLSNNYLRVEGVREITRALAHRAVAHVGARGGQARTLVGSRSGFGWLWGDVSDLVLGDGDGSGSVRTNFHSLSHSLSSTPTADVSDQSDAPAAQAAHRDIEVRISGNFPAAEVRNSVVHGIGTLAAIAGCAPMYAKTAALSLGHRGQDVYLLSCAVFVCAQIAFFASSTLNHSLYLTDASAVFRLIDHSCVFILIASSYTPFLTLNLRHVQPLSDGLLACVWGLAIVGVGVSTVWPSSLIQRRIRVLLYIFEGWMALVPAALLYPCIAPAGWALLACGGVVFSAGVGLYMRARAAVTVTYEQAAAEKTQGAGSRHRVSMGVNVRATGREMQWLWYVLVLFASVLHWCAVYHYAMWPSAECIEHTLLHRYTTPVLVRELQAPSAPIQPLDFYAGSLNGSFSDAFRDRFLAAMPGMAGFGDAGALLSQLAHVAAATAADSQRAFRESAIATMKNMIANMEA